jgi:hypothetical protein
VRRWRVSILAAPAEPDPRGFARVEGFTRLVGVSFRWRRHDVSPGEMFPLVAVGSKGDT